MKKTSLTALSTVKERLKDSGIISEISVVRENTPGEYSMILLKDPEQFTAANLLAIRKLLQNLSGDLELTIGYAGSLQEYPVIEIRPRYSFFTESERQKLDVN